MVLATSGGPERGLVSPSAGSPYTSIGLVNMSDAPLERKNFASAWNDEEGFLVVTGGESGSYTTAFDPNDETYIYHVDNDTWVRMGRAPKALCYHKGAWDPDGRRMVVVGGMSKRDANQVPEHDTWSYDPYNDTWTRLASHPNKVEDGFFAYNPLNGTFIYGGGYSKGVYLDDVFEYNVSDDAWTRLAAMPVVARSQTAVWDPGADRLLVYGGVNESQRALDLTFAYYPRNDTWVRATPGHEARMGARSVWDPSRHCMLVLGGQGGNTTDPMDVKGVSAYVPSTGKWYSVVNMTVLARAGHSAHWLSANASVLVYGGSNLTAVLNDTCILDFDPPSLLDSTPSSAMTGDALTVNVTISDNVAVAYASVRYWFGSGGQMNVVDLRLVSGNRAQGAWTFDVPIPLCNESDLHYVLFAEDAAGLTNGSTRRDVAVFDGLGPEIEDKAPRDATTGDVFTLSARVLDNIAVSNVSVVHWFGSAVPTNASMLASNVSANGNGTYTLDVRVPDDVLEPLWYYYVAVDINDNLNTTAVERVNVTDNDRPWFSKDVSTSGATTGDPVRFEVGVDDNIGIRSVQAVYWFGASGQRIVNMTPLNVTSTGVGTYSIEVLAPLHSLEALHCYVDAYDGQGNRNSTTEVLVNVTDDDAPTFGADGSSRNATTGDPLRLEVLVDDNIDIDRVLAVWWSGVSSPSRVVMTPLNVSGAGIGSYSVEVEVPSGTLEPMYYYFEVLDGSGNRDATDAVQVNVTDNDPPWFGSVPTPDGAFTGDTTRLVTDVDDNIDVEAVRAVYWFGTQDPTLTDMTPGDVAPDGTGAYSLVITIPLCSLDPLCYYIEVFDGAGNVNRTRTVRVNISDDDGPWFVDEASPPNATTGDPVHLEVWVEDNIDVVEARAVVWFGTSRPETLRMVPQDVEVDGTGTYVLTVTVGPSSLVPMYYYFEAVDSGGNLNRTATRGVNVTDDDMPMLVGDDSPSVATTGDPVHLEVQVIDNVGIDRVEVIYWIGTSDPVIVEMAREEVTGVGNGTYTQGTLRAPSDSLDSITYFFTAYDTSGNWNTTRVREITVVDDDPPSVEDGTDGEATTGDAFAINVRVMDNVGVSSIFVVYWYGDGPLTNTTLELVHTGSDDRGCIGRGMLSIPRHSLEPLSYYLGAVDTSGNSNTTSVGTVEVRDDDPPQFTEDCTGHTPIKGLTHEFRVVVSDNIAVATVWVEYWFDDGGRTRSKMIADEVMTRTIRVPRHPTGDLHYRFIADDTSGVENMTDEAVLTPVNRPPEIGTVPTWYVVEGSVGVLDLIGYITDPNDPISNLTLKCTSGNVTVSGFKLTVLQDVWTPEFSIDFLVTDGEDDTHATLVMHVVDVNDPPVIASDPPLEACVNRTYEYRLVVADEDPLEHFTFSLRVAPEGMGIDEDGTIRWTPGRDQHDYHAVFVTVSDGDAAVNQSWVILVSVVEDEPGNGPPRLVGTPRRDATAGEEYAWTATFEDPDGDSLFFHLVDGPPGSRVDTTSGFVHWNPPYEKREMSIDIPFAIEVSDGIHRVPLEYVVRLRFPPNRSPEISGTVPDVLTHGKCTLDLSGHMSDPDDPVSNLTWTFEEGDESLFTVYIDGNDLVVIPREGARGKAAIVLVLEDPSGARDSQSIVLEVAPWYVVNSGCLATLVVIIVVASIIATVAWRRGMFHPGREDEHGGPPCEADPGPCGVGTVEGGPGHGVYGASGSGASGAVRTSGGELAWEVEKLYIVHKQGRIMVDYTFGDHARFGNEGLPDVEIAILGARERDRIPKVMDYVDQKIVFADGEILMLAALVRGNPDDVLREMMVETLRRIELEYADDISGWDWESDDNPYLDELSRQIIAQTKNMKRESIAPSNVPGEVKVVSAVVHFGGMVRLKVAIVNGTNHLLADSAMEVRYNTDTLKLDTIEPKTMKPRGDRVFLGNVRPGEKTTVEFVFDPQVCHKTHIDGTLSYYDLKGVLKQVRMERRNIEVACPAFLTSETANLAALRWLVSERLWDFNHRTYEYPHGMDPLEVLRIGKMAVTEGVQLVREYIDDGPPLSAEVWYYAETKGNRYQMVMRLDVIEEEGVLEFFAASRSMEPVTGLLAEFNRRLVQIVAERLPRGTTFTPKKDGQTDGQVMRRPLLIERVSEIEQDGEDGSIQLEARGVR